MGKTATSSLEAINQDHFSPQKLIIMVMMIKRWCIKFKRVEKLVKFIIFKEHSVFFSVFWSYCILYTNSWIQNSFLLGFFGGSWLYLRKNFHVPFMLELSMREDFLISNFHRFQQHLHLLKGNSSAKRKNKVLSASRKTTNCLFGMIFLYSTLKHWFHPGNPGP